MAITGKLPHLTYFLHSKSPMHIQLLFQKVELVSAKMMSVYSVEIEVNKHDILTNIIFVWFKIGVLMVVQVERLHFAEHRFELQTH